MSDTTQQPVPLPLVQTLREAVVAQFCFCSDMALQDLATENQLPLFEFIQILEEPESQPLLAKLQWAIATRAEFLAADSRHAALTAILHKLRKDPHSQESLRLASTNLRTTKPRPASPERAAKATSATPTTRTTPTAADSNPRDAEPGKSAPPDVSAERTQSAATASAPTTTAANPRSAQRESEVVDKPGPESTPSASPGAATANAPQTTTSNSNQRTGDSEKIAPATHPRPAQEVPRQRLESAA